MGGLSLKWNGNPLLFFEVFMNTGKNRVDSSISYLLSVLLLMMPVMYLLSALDILPAIFFDAITVFDLLLIFSTALCAALLFLAVLRGRWSVNRACFTAAMAFFGSAVISTVLSENMYTALYGNSFSREGLLHLLCYMVFMMTAAALKERHAKRRICSALLAVGVLESLLAIMQSCFRISWNEASAAYLASSGYRAFGTFGNQNPFGAFMGMVFCLSYGRAVEKAEKRGRLLAAAMMALFFYTIVLSGTRAAILGAVVSFLLGGRIVYSYAKKQSAIGKMRISFAIYTICVIMAIAAAGITSASLSDTLWRVFSDIQNIHLADWGSGRLQIWKQAWEQFLEHPFFGTGPANFIYQTGNFSGTLYGMNYNMSIAYVVHNQYLEILTTQGIFGAITYSLMFFFVFREAVHKWKSSLKGYNADDLGCILAVVGFLITDVFGWRNVYLTPYFYVLLGLLLTDNSEADGEVSFAEMEYEDEVEEIRFESD